jgi:hypothetical protein
LIGSYGCFLWKLILMSAIRLYASRGICILYVNLTYNE